MSGLRRRGGGSDYGDDSEDNFKISTKTISKNFKQLDLFSKLDVADSRTTNAGGLAVLIVSEIAAYVSSSTREHITVDPTVGQRMSIHFDVTFHALRCKDVNFDALDIAGEQSDGIQQDIRKQRVSPTGRSIGWPFVYHLPVPDTAGVVGGAGVNTPTGPGGANRKGYCGTCYGAESEERPCCNNCHALKAAYLDHGWSTTGLDQNAEQCVREASEHQDEDGRPGEGCRTWGVLKVNKVAGTLYSAMGETHIKGYKHIHQFNPTDIPKYNISHTVHDLSFFGDHKSWLATLSRSMNLATDAHREHNPLDGRHFSAEKVSGMMHYYLKVVPMSSDGYTSSDSQYAVNSVFKPSIKDGMRQNVLPGVYFVYDLSPFMVTVENTSESLITFLMQLFAIAGGVVATLRMLDVSLDALLSKAAGSIGMARSGRGMI